jgi:hypothetical protein
LGRAVTGEVGTDVERSLQADSVTLAAERTTAIRTWGRIAIPRETHRDSKGRAGP